LALASDQQEFTTAYGEGCCRKEIAPAAFDLELLYGQHNEAFRRNGVYEKSN